jgi:glycosyltransferase involved in cell wall biosynthesis
VTACSVDLARRALALGAAPDRVEVVPYGVDAARFRPDAGVRRSRRDALGIADGVPVVFAAGRLVRKKGFEYLIDALPAVTAKPRPVLAIAGAGDLAGELAARARQAGVADRVRFLGNLTQDEIGEWLAAADLAVAPSVRDDSGNVDGLPNVVLEALASGTALITTGAGGIAEVVDNDRTGVIVAERDAPALASAIDALLQDPDRRARLAREARARVETRYGWPAAAARFEAAYERALAFKSAPR